jgi:DNA-binding GntR family transcriptional regulator
MAALSVTRTFKDSLVDYLRDDIVRGTYAPGEYLRLDDIAARFNVSTMPVREALRDLEAEGLVTIFPHRCAIVTELTAEELEDIYDIRATLEAIATRSAVAQMSEDTCRELAEIVARMDEQLGHVARLVQLNHQFHSTLYAASGRRHLCDLNRTLRHRTQHYLHAYIEDSGSMALAQAEHRAILEACRQGDAEKAASLVKKHVAEVGQAIVEYVRLRHNTPQSWVGDEANHEKRRR